MKLQGRNLSIRMQGDDVKLLQDELRRLDLPTADRQGLFGEATRGAVMEFQRKRGLEATGVVDERTAEQINKEVDARRPAPQPVGDQGPLIVRGRVRNGDGSPFVRGLVRAFDKDMRTEELLGETATDEAGHYEIQYTADKFNRAEKGSADLRVCACNEGGLEIASSIIIFNASPVATVDLVIGGEVRAPSEFERFVAELAPVTQGVSFAELREDEAIQDVTFLSGETGIPPRHVAFLVLAHRHARITRLLPEAFYGLFRQNLPTRLDALLAQHTQVQRRALEAALRDNIIPAKLRADLDGILARLQELIVEHAFKEPEVPDTYSLSAILGTAASSRELQASFLSQYVRHEGAIEEFWEALRASPEFSASGLVERVQYALQLGVLTGNHLPLVKLLQQDRAITSLRDLATLDAESWLKLLNQQVDGRRVGFPPDVPGADETAKARTYATALARMIEDAFPTAVIAHRIEADDSDGAPFAAEARADLVTFLRNDPAFEFGNTNIEKHLRAVPDATGIGVADKARLKENLKAIQRLTRVTPRYDDIRVLWADGHRSAQSVARMSKGTFVRKYGGTLGGRARAKTIHARASQIAAMALTLFGKYATVFHTTVTTPQALSPLVTGKSPINPNYAKAVDDLKEAIPNWTTLFGPAALCECEHCKSVYGPAAYLVDLLEFLKDSPPALTNLLKRRPDLQYIELSCENTNTPLPYVDLVDEVLENAVAPLPLVFDIASTFASELDNKIVSPGLTQAFQGQGIALSAGAAVAVDEKGAQWTIVDRGWRYSIGKGAIALAVSTVPQTRGAADELRANPEYISQQAYEVLGLQVYPFDLPLNLWAVEARTYLEHLGVRRHQLMEAFRKEAPPSGLIDAGIAAEYLGLTPEEASIVTGATTSGPALPTSDPGPWNLWGFSKANITPIPDPADDSKTIAGIWSEVVKRVDVFLQQAGLRYKELLDLIDTAFVNPAKTLSIQSTDPADPATCDLAKLAIVNLTPAALATMHRFIRLWRKLGWTMGEFDRAITAFKPGDLSTSFLVQLSHVQRLRTDLPKVPLLKMLSWWATIDTATSKDGTSSLYEQLFLNKAVMNPVDDAFKLDQLAGGAGAISAHVPTLLAALGVSESDLSILTKKDTVQAVLGLTDATVANDVLDLENLSRLHRAVSLAKALKLSIRDFLLVREMTGVNPFDAAHTENALQFVERVQKVRASGFKITDLDYLLRHHLVAPSAIAPPEETVALMLDDLRSGLQKIAAENTFTPGTVEPTTELLEKKVATLLPADHVGAAIALIDGTTTETEANQNAFIDTYLSIFLDAADAKVKLVGAGALADKDARIAYVLAPLMDYLRRTLSESFVKQKMAEALKLETAAAELLLFKLVKSPADVTKMAILLDPAFIASQSVLTQLDFAPQFQAVILLHKIAALISGFKMRSEELDWLLAHGGTIGWLDMNALPLAPGAPSAPLFASWERLVDVFDLLDKHPLLRNKLSSEEWNNLASSFGTPAAPVPSHPALLAGFELAAQFNPSTGSAADAESRLLDMLSARTRWDRKDLTFLVGPKGFGLSFPAAYKDERALLRLRACCAVLKRLGVSAPQVLEASVEWTQATVKPEVSRAIKQAVKAKYDDAQWLVVAKPLRDALRARQRSALTSYLVAHPDQGKGQRWRDANGLYEHFLIDVEMDPCMMTSRIKQAIGSVQLFVQRCLMNLEEGVSLSTEQALQWNWMKAYRVWEANRKVFLYAENFVVEELRDNKSPFFKELQNQLLQNEVTKDTAEDAFLHYLEKLDSVARLEVVGLYHQVETDQPNGKGSVVVDRLHVFGRTHGTPPIYYYRQRVDSSYWTPWQKVDVDIEGDHLIPVVWNRRVHIFWAIFTEKAKQDEPLPGPNQTGWPPSKFWDIKIAWSEYRNGKWSAKRASQTDVAREGAFGLGEYDKGQFYFSAVVSGAGDLAILVRHPLIEFDKRFGFQMGCDGKGTWGQIPWITATYKLEALPNTDVEFMKFVENAQGDSPLDLVDEKHNQIAVLNKTPGTFLIPHLHQYQVFDSREAFFFEDDHRTFFVEPRDEKVYPSKTFKPDKVHPVDLIHFYYYPPDFSPPIPDSDDPLIFEGSFAVETSVALASGTGGA